MAAFVAIYRSDLAAPSRVTAIPHVFAEGDHESHTFTVLVYNSRDPMCGVMAGQAAGYAVRADGCTVPLTGVKGAEPVEIELPDGTPAQATACSVTLIQGCFAVPGPITVAVRLIDGERQTAVFLGRGTVAGGMTGTLVDPGDVVGDITSLIDAAGQAADGAAEALAMASAVVSYEAQTPTAQQQAAARANLGAASLEETLRISPPDLAAGTAWTNGKSIRYTDGTTRNTSYFRSTGYIGVSGCASIVCPRIVSTASASGTPYGIAFYDAQKVFVPDAGVQARWGAARSGWELQTVPVPAGAAYMRATWFPEENAAGAGAFFCYDAEALAGTLASRVTRLDDWAGALLGSVAPVERMTASANHAAGDLVLVDGRLYRLTAPVAAGDPVNDYASPTTVAAQLKSLEARIAALE